MINSVNSRLTQPFLDGLYIRYLRTSAENCLEKIFLIEWHSEINKQHLLEVNVISSSPLRNIAQLFFYKITTKTSLNE